jgi:hypothetical protein
MDENQSEPPEQITPVKLATLAALIDPKACQSGNSWGTLLQALALFEESASICEEMESRSLTERIELLQKDSLSGSSGVHRLFEALVNPILNAPQPVLTLAARDNGSDMVRPYLADELNLEGKTGRKVWSRTRTVHDNLRLMYIDQANHWNLANAARILAQEHHEDEQGRSDRREAQRRGYSVELISAGRFRPGGWRDGRKEFEKLMSRCEVSKQGKVHHYEIPQVVITALVEWKRKIRRTPGGIRAIRPLSREEVLGKAVKKKNPKRRM